MLSSQEQSDYAVDQEDWQSRSWMQIGIRFAPVLAVLALAVAVWPSSGDENLDTDETSVIKAESTQPTATVAAQAESADGRFSNEPLERPQLLVQGTVVGEDADVNTSTEATTSSTIDGQTTTSAEGGAGAATTATTAGAGANTPTSADESSNTTAGSSGTQGPQTSASTVAQTTAPTTATTSAPTTAPPATSAPSGDCNSNGEFERVFRDDFNGPSLGGAWSQYNGPGNRGYGYRRPAANTVSDGKLIITARMENEGLVSGGLRHNLELKYGKFVARVRTDNDPSQSMSGVVLTWPESGDKHRDGENNIYETLVKTPNRNPFYTFVHKPFGNAQTQESYRHNADGSQFQTMTMEWTPTRITITREGPGSSSSDSWTVNETSANLIPDVRHHLAIQLDGWQQSVGGTVRMEVDYVEIHKFCG